MFAYELDTECPYCGQSFRGKSDDYRARHIDTCRATTPVEDSYGEESEP